MRESILMETLASVQKFCSFPHDVRALGGEMHLLSDSNKRHIGACVSFMRVSHFSTTFLLSDTY